MSDQQNFTPQVAQSIYNRVRYDYIQNSHKNPSIHNRIEGLIPYIFVMLEVCLFMLSASHTLDVVSRFVPGIGSWFALGIEISMVALAFMIYRIKYARQTIERLWNLLEFLFFILLICTNVGGSILMIFGNFTGGPVKATDIITAVVACVVSIIIPIATVVVGQALAKLFMDRLNDGDPIEQKWRMQAYDYLYPELFTAALSSGLTPGKAKQLAHQTALGFTGGNKQLVSLSANSVSPDNRLNPDTKADSFTDKTPDKVTFKADKLLTAAGMADKPKPRNKKQQAIQMFRDDPSLMEKNLRDLSEMSGIDRTTLGEAKQVINSEA